MSSTLAPRHGTRCGSSLRVFRRPGPGFLGALGRVGSHSHKSHALSLCFGQDHGVPNASPGFAVVVLSTLDPKEAELELKDKLPWGLMRPIRVTAFIPASHAHLADLKR
jgi:hypothetical protein